MKIRDLLTQEIDIDVCDSVYDSYYHAFVGPVELTEDGIKEFADVLNYDIYVYDSDRIAIIDLDNIDDYAIRHRRAKYFFAVLAGYVEDSLFKQWVKE